MKQLFIDDHIIERTDNLVRKLHQPDKFGAVLRPEYRWENIGTTITTAPMWDPVERIYRLVYGTATEPVDITISDLMMNTVSAPQRGQNFFCYAVSTNGVNWEKPFLGLHDYECNSYDGKPIAGKNNIIPRGITPIQDLNDPDPNRRYKAQNHGDGPSKEKLFAVSPDCLNWEWLDVPPIPEVGTSAFSYDDEKGLFILTVKRKGPYGRSVYLTTSEDFKEWTEPQLIFNADELDQENGKERIAKFFQDPDYLSPGANRPEEYKTDIYQLPVFPYEGMYIGMPTMFHHSGKSRPMYENVDGRKTIELVSSRNLRNWNRVASRHPFIEQSPLGDGNAYDTGQLVPSNQPVIRNNELWFYYGGYRHRDLLQGAAWDREYLDGSAICLAKLRLDGFVSLKGGIECGSVLTKPIVVEGNQLHINVNSWRGQVTVEILNAAGNSPVAGFENNASIPSSIDSIDATMHWKNKSDISELLGRTVRLRFSLLDAEIFAFWFIN